MRSIVVYQSQTGFTARYALWISQAAETECLALPAAKKVDWAAYDTVIFGSWVRAGTICRMRWLKRKLAAKWSGRRVIVFCVGASPIDNPETAVFIRNLRSELKGAEVFYCPGGFSYEKMSLPSRLMMKMFLRSLRAKKEKTPEDEAVIHMISSSYDISDQKYIGPILECLNRPRPSPAAQDHSVPG